MPSKGTPPRTIRVPDLEWRAAGASAAALGSDLSAELRATIHELATRRTKEIRMPATATTARCTWENPCATCVQINASCGIVEPSVVHNPWVMVPARDLRQGDTLRDLGGGAHILGEVAEVTTAGAAVHWSDGEKVTYPTKGRAVQVLRALREGELTFRQQMAAR